MSTKQTAANNAFLRTHKKIWNGKVYTKLLVIINRDGEQAARAYLQSLLKPGTDLDSFATSFFRYFLKVKTE